MAGAYDPYSGARGGPPQRRRRAGPTLEDYEALVQAYQELKQQYSDAIQRLGQQEEQIRIKDDALQRQTADLQQLEAQGVWNKAALEQAQQKLEALEEGGADEKEWQQRFARLQADMENMRRRWEKRFADETANERNNVLAEMIPLADHLDMALQYADNQSEDPQITNSGFFKRFVGNIEATKQAFLNTLKRYNVTPIDAVGQPFDPSFHEAVGRVPSGSVAPDLIAQVVQLGYKNGDKLLRPARVLLSSGGETAEVEAVQANEEAATSSKSDMEESA